MNCVFAGYDAGNRRRLSSFDFRLPTDFITALLPLTIRYLTADYGRGSHLIFL
jgi:hypothetical protein